MSNLTLDHPTSARRDLLDSAATDLAAITPPSVGSYVDTDGVRRAPRHIGEYVSSRSTRLRRVGSYTDVDGGRSTARLGSYVRSER